MRLNHVDETLSAAKIKNVLLETLVTHLIFALAIVVFFFSPDLAHYIWLLILPSKIIIRKKYPYK